MQVTGPFTLTAGVTLNLVQPSQLQLAMKVENNSPYQLTIQFSNKSYSLEPFMQDIIMKSPNVNSVDVLPLALSGTIATGTNADLTVVWYDQNDDIQTLRVGHPVSLSANSVASGSTISGSVEITAPVDAGSRVEVVQPATSTATIVSVSSSTVAQNLFAADSSCRGLLFANNTTETALVALGSTATASNFSLVVPAGANVILPAPVPGVSSSVIWATAGAGSFTATQLS